MTPCFASRVPTGRIPGQVAAEQAAKGHGLMRGNVKQRAEPNAGAMQDEPMQPPALQVARTLDEELQAEITEFHAVHYGKAEAQGRRSDDPCQPRYTVMRRVRSAATGCNGLGLTSAPIAADSRYAGSEHSELSDIEDSADQLEQQLVWWRQHMEKLARHEACDSHEDGMAEGSARSECAELRGDSEWLNFDHCDGTAGSSPESPQEEHSGEHPVEEPASPCPSVKRKSADCDGLSPSLQDHCSPSPSSTSTVAPSSLTPCLSTPPSSQKCQFADHSTPQQSVLVGALPAGSEVSPRADGDTGYTHISTSYAETAVGRMHCTNEIGTGTGHVGQPPAFSERQATAALEAAGVMEVARAWAADLAGSQAERRPERQVQVPKNLHVDVRSFDELFNM